MNRAALYSVLFTCMFFFGNACSSLNHGPPPEDEPPPKAVICKALSFNECAASAGCELMSAVRYEVDRGCRHPAAPVACVSGPEHCPAVLTYARDLQNNTWMFPSGCLPGGWSAFEAREEDRVAISGLECSSGGGVEPACSQRSLEECEALEGCTLLSAGRYDVERVCRYSLAPVACAAEDTCQPSTVYAKDLKNNRWVFPSTCLPEGWEGVVAEDKDRAAVRGPECQADGLY